MSTILDRFLAGQISPEQNYGQPEPEGALANVVDFLSRPNYASAAFFDTLMSEEGLAIGRALSVGGQELLDPEERLTFSDLIKKHDPGFAQTYPLATGVLGFIGDVALDPTTYLGFGAARGATKITIPAIQKVEKIEHAGRKVVNKLGKMSDARFPEGTLRRTETVRTAFGKYGDLRFKHKAKVPNEIEYLAKDTVADRVYTLNKQGRKMYDDFVRQELHEGWQLTDDGIDMAVELAQHRVDKYGDEPGDAFALALNRVLKAAGRRSHSMKDWGRTTSVVQAERAAEKRVASALMAMDDLELNKFIDRGGIKFAGKTVVAGDKVAAAAESLRIISGLKWLKHTKPVTMLRRSLIRHADIPQELIDAERTFHASMQKHELDTIQQAERMFSDLNADQRKRIGQLGHDLDAWANELRYKRRKSPQEVQDEINRLIRKSNLSTEERDVLTQMLQKMQTLAHAEQEANLLHHARTVYFPRYYEALKDGKRWKYLRHKMRAGMSESFDRDLARKFRTVSEAKEHGFDPVLDAGALYVRRVMDSHRALERAHFNQSIKTVIPELEEFADILGKLDVDKVDPKFVKQYIKGLPSQLRHIAQHVNFVGDGLYSRLAPDEFNYMMRGMDRLTNLFRASATVARPAFAGRQVISNLWQSFLGAGIVGLRHVTVDPRSAWDAFLALNGRGDYAFRSVFGRKWTGAEFLQAARDNHVIRNVSIEGIGKGSISGPRGSKRLMKEIDRIRQTKQVFGDNAAAYGMGRMVSGVLDYTHVPAMVEDWGRLTLFGNLLRHGYDTPTAAKMVDDALFDYTHGLSKFEERWIRRFVPFYSYQRFAVPLVTRAAAQAPGRIVNSVKAGKALMRAYGKVFDAVSGGTDAGPLTTEERNAIPGFLIEQPAVFAGWTKDMEARHAVFNNFSPLDVFSFISSDEQGDLNIRETVMKVGLAQLSPIVKIPLEMALKKDFFTGRAMDGAYRGGELNVDALLGNLLAMGSASYSAGTHRGSATLAMGAGKMLGVALSAMAPEQAKTAMKSFLMMEEGIDPYTGKQVVYFSPYAMHVLQSIMPGLNEAVKVSRTDKTPIEKTTQFLFGIGTHKSDLQRTQSMKARNIYYEAQEKKKEYKKALVEERYEAAQKALLELQEYLDDHRADLEMLTGPVRGATYGPQ